MSDLSDFLKKIPPEYLDPMTTPPNPAKPLWSAQERAQWIETDLTPYYSAVDKAIQELMRKQQLPPSLQRQLRERSVQRLLREEESPHQIPLRYTTGQYHLFPKEETYRRPSLKTRLWDSLRSLSQRLLNR